MKQEIKYDSVKDLAEVDQFGFIDINKAFANGYVPGSNSSVTVEFDDAEDPSAIIGKPSDVFEAMRMQDVLMAGIKEANASANPKGSSKDEN